MCPTRFWDCLQLVGQTLREDTGWRRDGVWYFTADVGWIAVSMEDERRVRVAAVLHGRVLDFRIAEDAERIVFVTLAMADLLTSARGSIFADLESMREPS